MVRTGICSKENVVKLGGGEGEEFVRRNSPKRPPRRYKSRSDIFVIFVLLIDFSYLIFW